MTYIHEHGNGHRTHATRDGGDVGALVLDLGSGGERGRHTFSKSTSPTSLYPCLEVGDSTELVPTSMMTAPTVKWSRIEN